MRVGRKSGSSIMIFLYNQFVTEALAKGGWLYIIFYLFCCLVNRRLQSRGHSGAIGGRVKNEVHREAT